MDNTKWVVTAISVCIVGSLLFAGVTTANNTSTILQQTTTPDFSRWNVTGDASNITLSTSEVEVERLYEDTSVEVKNRDSNFPGKGNGTIVFTVNVTDASFFGDGSAVNFNGVLANFNSIGGPDVRVTLQREPQGKKVRFRSDDGTDIAVFEAGYHHRVEMELKANEGRVYYRVWNESDGGTLVATHDETYDNTVVYNETKAFATIDGSNENEWISGRWYNYEVYGEEKGVLSDYRVSGRVTDSRGNPIRDARVKLSRNGTANATVRTGTSGYYSTVVNENVYNVTTSKTGYLAVEDTLNVTSDTSYNATLIEEGETFRFVTESYIRHGDSAEYEAYYRPNQSTDWKNVTGSVSVTSSNNSVVSVNLIENVLEATSDRSINERVTITAEYKDVTATQNVTVANETIDNLDILPTTQKFTAVIGGGTDANPADRSYLAIFLATALASAVSLIATVTAGLAIIPVVLFAAMVVGFVDIQVVIAATLVSVFLGLNIAKNIDYGVR